MTFNKSKEANRIKKQLDQHYGPQSHLSWISSVPSKSNYCNMAHAVGSNSISLLLADWQYIWQAGAFVQTQFKDCKPAHRGHLTIDISPSGTGKGQAISWMNTVCDKVSDRIRDFFDNNGISCDKKWDNNITNFKYNPNSIVNV